MSGKCEHGLTTRPAEGQAARTGWPPGMLQDDCKELSKALANKPDAMRHARESAQAIRDQAEPVAQWGDPRVQTVYDLMCSEEVPPGDAHWEGWTARRIVDALAPPDTEKLLAENEALRKDAERYRWHRQVGGKSWVWLETQQIAKGEMFDAATDAAIAGKTPKN